MPKGFVFYSGPSALVSGRRIVGIATWGSVNPKTGDCLQTWILVDGMPPVEAVRNNADDAICGDCRWKHGGEAPMCYVQRFQAPRSIYDTYAKGLYRTAPRRGMYGITVRLGAYGDPYAIPVKVWDDLMRSVKTSHWVGYTQFWERPDAEGLKKYCMASVATEQEALKAQSMGWRTYRITIPGGRNMSEEITCPHYTKGIQCARCNLCNGDKSKAKSITAPVHGTRAKHFIEWYDKGGYDSRSEYPKAEATA